MEFLNCLFVCLLGPGKPGSYLIIKKKKVKLFMKIINNDKIKDKYFLLPNINNIDYINKDIYIVQYPGGNDLSYSEGKIKDIINYELIYDASTQSGTSGSLCIYPASIL